MRIIIASLIGILAVAVLANAVSAAPAGGEETQDHTKDISGHWSWFNAEVYLYNNISTVNSGISEAYPKGSTEMNVVTNNGTWTKSGNSVTIEWTMVPFVDTLTLSKNGLTLSGTNNKGKSVTGDKVVPTATPTQNTAGGGARTPLSLSTVCLACGIAGLLVIIGRRGEW